ncbi:ArsR/SmtB family transcription factor [Natrononativus amylolyticus]|uniref:ArsR/SmtB family transcription factor n=1 Tax=Natrononativus amylolyticus TaxID=2963434 RepID=UPI0020CDDCD1|nr:helix-turn-helix domain-containing protein [Natrononativus amylolyticus]
MARLFPLRSDTPTQEGQPRVVDLADEDADAVFGALSSTTARRIYATLDDEPGTPSDVAEAIDSSIQNVRYHLEKLEDAGLVEVVDTWYSSRGNEMSVYATADGPLIVTSDESKAAQLKTALSRFIGGLGALAGGSLLVQYGLERFFAPGQPADTEAAPADDAESDAADTADGADSADEPTGEEEVDAPADEGADADAPEDTDDAAFTTQQESAEDAEDAAAGDDRATDDADAPDDTDTADDVDPEYYADEPTAANETAPPETAPDGGAEAAEAVFATIPPGLLFFLGGLVVLVAVTVYWYWTTTY